MGLSTLLREQGAIVRRKMIGLAAGILTATTFATSTPAVAGGGQEIAAGVDLAPAMRRLASLLPPSGGGWTIDGEPESMNVPGLTQLQQRYVRTDGKPGALSVIVTQMARRAAPGAGATYGGSGGTITSVNVNGIKANLMFVAAERGGTLSFNAGRHTVVVTGEDVTGAEIAAQARRIDTAALTKL